MNLQTFKAETIQQYYILEHLRKHFLPGTLKRIELVDRYTVLIEDRESVTEHLIYTDSNRAM